MVLEQLMEREMLHVWRHYGQRRKKEQQFGGKKPKTHTHTHTHRQNSAKSTHWFASELLPAWATLRSTPS